MQYVVGKCLGCGGTIVRCYLHKHDTGHTVTYVCSCPPFDEKMGKMIKESVGLVVWDEQEE